mgnify:FL=1
MIHQPGDIILEKYRIKEKIGQGAFGEVYHATHQTLKVSRAIKVLTREMPGVGSTVFQEYEARYRLEMQLGARINHPNLIQVYDAEYSQIGRAHV